MAIIRYFRQYVTPLYEYGGIHHNTTDEYSENEFLLVGIDFIIDLLIVIDVL